MAKREIELLKQLPRNHRRRISEAVASGDYRATNPQSAASKISEMEESILYTELRCPICLCLMREPVATDCLHRFCKDCIERCQR